jgi:hypothetical protein
MPQDPLSALASMMQQQLSQAAQTLNQINMGLAKAVTLPLQMLGAGMQGAGSFNAKMTTSQLNSRNIFGSGGGT